jgi:GAF domain-containing protein
LGFGSGLSSVAETYNDRVRIDKLKRVPSDVSERRRAEHGLRRHAERQALLLEVTSDLIRTSEPAELGRVTFEHITSAFGADICFNYRLDPQRQCLRLEFARGIPPDKLEAARSLQLGQAFCGTAVGGDWRSLMSGRVCLPVIGLSDRASYGLLQRRLRFELRTIGRRRDLRVDDARIH